jgi:hypothetical protein
MPRPSIARPFAIALALTLLPLTAESQRRGRDWPPQHRRTAPALALEASGLFTRGDRAATSDASGFEVMGSVGSGVVSLGGGWQRSTVRRTAAGQGAELLDGWFVEPRLALPLAVGNFTPYLLGRAAWLTSRPPATATGTPERAATQLGGGVGTLVWLAPNVQLNTALLLLDTRLDGGAPAPIAGRSFGLRAGLTLGFDRWGR